jgi:hypothetical protein
MDRALVFIREETMTRKHYMAIAEALAQATIDSDMSDSAIKALDAAINNLSDFFAGDNASFNKSKFISHINKRVSELQ